MCSSPHPEIADHASLSRIKKLPERIIIPRTALYDFQASAPAFGTQSNDCLFFAVSRISWKVLPSSG